MGLDVRDWGVDRAGPPGASPPASPSSHKETALAEQGPPSFTPIIPFRARLPAPSLWGYGLQIWGHGLVRNALCNSTAIVRAWVLPRFKREQQLFCEDPVLHKGEAQALARKAPCT